MSTTRCPLCSAVHPLTSLDRVDDHGNPVSAREAQQVAHERAVIAKRSAGEFRLFASQPAARPALRLVRTPAEVAPAAPAACPEGYFVADWDAARKARRAEMAKAAKTRRVAAKRAIGA